MPISKTRSARFAVLALFSFVMAASTVAAAQSESILYRFGGVNDGSNPESSLVADGAGNLYGTTYYGGAFGFGTVFELPPPSSGLHQDTILYSFTEPYSDPAYGLVFDATGNLYGVSLLGGLYGNGAVFELSPPSAPGGAWAERVIYSFMNGTDGAQPSSNLIFDAAGNLYGTTAAGGENTICTFSCGTVFELSPPSSPGNPWTETVLHAFAGSTGNDGEYPLGTLVFDKSGALYGTAAYGGIGKIYSCTKGCGTVFKLAPPPISGQPWKETVLWAPLNLGAGAAPAGGVIFSNDGALYGTTEVGGPAGLGVVFKLTRSSNGRWTPTILYSFTGGADGFQPMTGVLLGNGGKLFGTTAGYEVPQLGTVFELTPPGTEGGSWTETTLHSFAGSTDGAYPQGLALIGGSLYGATYEGGRGTCHNGCGTVFRVTP